MKKERIKTGLMLKLGLLLTVSTLMILVSIIISVLGLRHSDNQFSEFVNGEVQLYSSTKDVYTYGLERNVAIRNLIMWPYDKQTVQDVDAAISRFNKGLSDLQPMVQQYGLDSEYNQIFALNKKDAKLIGMAEQTVLDTKTEFNSDAFSDIQVETATWRDMTQHINHLLLLENKMFLQKKQAIHQSIVLRIRMIFVLFGLFIVFTVLNFWIMRRGVVAPIRRLSSHVKQIAEGDLRGGSIQMNQHDEMGQLAADVETMTDNLRQMIHSIQHTAETVSVTSRQFSEETDGMKESGVHMAGLAEYVTKGMQEQYTAIQSTDEIVQEMKGNLQRMTETAASVSDAAFTSADLAQQGHQAVQTLSEQMDAIEQGSNASVDSMAKYGDHTKEINNIVRAMKEISSQINILSLNAAIEAATAGEHGRGFSVVAEEIRKLSSDTDRFMAEIEHIVSLIMQDTQQVSGIIEQNHTQIHQGSAVIRDFGRSFEEILLSAHNVSSQIQEVNAFIEEMSAGYEQMASSSHDIKGQAQASTEQVNGMQHDLQEQQSTLSSLAGSSQGLKEVSLELGRMLKRFTV